MRKKADHISFSPQVKRETLISANWQADKQSGSGPAYTVIPVNSLPRVCFVRETLTWTCLGEISKITPF